MTKKLYYKNVQHTDMDTGEIICETHGVTKIQDTEKNEYLDRNIINFCKGVGFVKIHTSVLNELAKKLTPTEFTFFIQLGQFVSYTDCILRRTSHGNSSVMDLQMLAEEIGEPYDKVRKLISSLKRKGLVGLHETGSIGVDSRKNKAYTVNPFVMFRGTDVNSTIAEFYRKTGWCELLEFKSKN